ncbi:hypothetical protein B7453_07570 [Pseudomonas sp. IB20]|uniref:hypothetical protein n=1 Tax=Pseudomonas TaxID=286 RepID=UPI000BA0272F|nr:MULTISPECIES: hypothetical protein [unclassified Pseudomonas]MCV2226281.1 hypothetical protein [Pseudomonas sp. AU10]OZO05166.1 hypothetical protein B7453_07570 [Pseudomonas sp. IB20]
MPGTNSEILMELIKSGIIMELIKIILPSSLIIIGWIVVSRGNDRRETRKEIRQFLDRSLDSVDSIREKAIECLTLPDGTGCKKLELAIEPELMRLDHALNLLNLKISGNKISAIGLRTAVTNNGCYRVTGRQELNLDHRVLQDINTQAAELAGNLEAAYRDTYQKDK